MTDMGPAINTNISCVGKIISLCARQMFSKTCLTVTLKTTENWFSRPKDQVSLNAGQKYCRVLEGAHSALLSTFNKLQFVIRTYVLSIFDWPLKTGFTVDPLLQSMVHVYSFIASVHTTHVTPLL